MLVKNKNHFAKNNTILAFFLLLFIIAFYAAFFSPLFKIKNIVSEGYNFKQQISHIIAAKKIFYGLIPSNNLILANKKWFVPLLFPEIKSFDIEKNFFKKTLILRFNKRQEALNWCVPKATDNLQPTTDNLQPSWQCFYTDKEGVLFKESPLIESSQFIQIKDLTQTPLQAGSRVNPEIIVFVHSVFDATQGKNPIISHFEINDYNLREITAIAQNLRILLNLKEDSQKQIANLFTLIDYEIKTDIEKIDYIDLRNNNKIFYRLRQ